MALVLEYCAYGTADDNLDESVTWPEILYKWTKDMALGINYLHSVSFYNVRTKSQVHNIIHRDIKPANSLVTDTFGIKVSDFGEARASDLDNTMTMVGTPFYVAPEIIKGERYSISADTFSYAVTLLAFALKGTAIQVFLRESFVNDKKAMGMEETMENVSDNRVMHNIVNKLWRPPSLKTELKHKGLPSTIAELIDICWLDDPRARPAFSEIVDYLMLDAMTDIMGKGENGTARRQSTGRKMGEEGGGLGQKIDDRKLEKLQAKEGGADIGGDVEALVVAWNKDGKGEEGGKKEALEVLGRVKEKIELKWS